MNDNTIEKELMQNKFVAEANERLSILELPQIEENDFEKYLKKVVELSVKFGAKRGYLDELEEDGRAEIIEIEVTNLKNISRLYGILPYFILRGRANSVDGIFLKIAFVDCCGAYNSVRVKDLLKTNTFENIFLFCPMFKSKSKFINKNVGFKKLSDGRIRADSVLNIL